MENFKVTIIFMTILFITRFSCTCFAQENTVMTIKHSPIFPESEGLLTENPPPTTMEQISPGSLEYIVFVDGKLPYSICSYISFDSICKLPELQYYYSYGYKRYSYSLSLLTSLSDTTKVFIRYTFDELVGDNQNKKHTYYDTLLWGTLKGVNMVSIANIKPQKHIYYIYYVLDPPYGLVPYYNKKKYGNYKEFKRKVYKPFYPRSYYTPQKRHEKGFLLY